VISLDGETGTFTRRNEAGGTVTRTAFRVGTRVGSSMEVESAQISTGSKGTRSQAVCLPRASVVTA
jgi:hypothetical protein